MMEYALWDVSARERDLIRETLEKSRCFADPPPSSSLNAMVLLTTSIVPTVTPRATVKYTKQIEMIETRTFAAAKARKGNSEPLHTLHLHQDAQTSKHNMHESSCTTHQRCHQEPGPTRLEPRICREVSCSVTCENRPTRERYQSQIARFMLWRLPPVPPRLRLLLPIGDGLICFFLVVIPARASERGALLC